MNNTIMYVLLFGAFFVLPLVVVLALGGFFSHRTSKVIMVRRARFIPSFLFIASVVVGIVVSPWWLLSLPFVIIGALFTAPNLNLVNGMPSYLSMLAGFILMQFHQPSGLAILAGVIVSFYGSALEMHIFAKPHDGYH
jgi:hypothetical protein